MAGAFPTNALASVIFKSMPIGKFVQPCKGSADDELRLVCT